ncbi:unnamed protein product [Arctia plantaginis]|uniref:Uncharacterized protein n=1 Tax=Arctia plantaginis TaxID=874455 RepID=A0A8S1AHA6_ARCPL|nr:unnamed protein product [Arctia plantaginis]CAB3260651.1 unnamed protein product [Arctia plantaginis]
MKLIPLIISLIRLAVDTEGHESFTLPTQFQGSQPGMFSAEKQFYLPPESQTVLPYYPMKNFNNLQFPYLPSTIPKSPIGTRSPFPILLSTTLLPMSSDEDDDDNQDKPFTPTPHDLRNQYNRTQRDAIHKPNRREIRPVPKNYQHPIDRIDTKLPVQLNTNSESATQNSGTQSMSPRSIIISDIQRDTNMDQLKSANFMGAQFVSHPGVFMSTTETAIPILRLSNEMDLDGSFSYEALGADQTHYVQHSRMENTGDKEEQVVEGSYSYVGDDGKTYTVHYIADSNGFRASGEHLPVAPPIPEIIQRSVQFNLAEELKKPPHFKLWNEEEKENELTENRHHFAVSPPHLSNLFTGRNPESFSHSFSQSSNTQNNLIAAASSQTPIQTVDFPDQILNKQNSGTISPQITFLASQGAHAPSVNAPQQQQHTVRIFTTERPTMPQIVNYEANMKDTDQESNKALWRWQYGINANLNRKMDKNLISRSSSEDDVSVNFSEMTADQYTKMLEQLEPNMKITSEIPDLLESSNNQQHYYDNLNSYPKVSDMYQYNKYILNTVNPITYSSEKNTPSDKSTTKEHQHPNYNRSIEEITKESHSEVKENSKSKIITQDQFIPHSQTVTRSYNYDDNGFESRKTRVQNKNTENNNMNLNVIPLRFEKNISNKTSLETNQIQIKPNGFTTQEPSSAINKHKFTDFIIHEDSKNGFKPIISISKTQPISHSEITTTTEINIEDMLKQNIFLKNFFQNNKNNQETSNKLTIENKNLQVKPISETKTDKYANPKYIYYDLKPYNEIKSLNSRPMDIANIMNYLARNQFESTKLRSETKQLPNSIKQKTDTQYFTDEDDQEMVEDKSSRNQPTLYQHELRGAIKNYKVLQRNKNMMNTQDDHVDGPKMNLSPPPVQMYELPPLGRAGPTVKTYLPPVYVKQ